MDFHRAVHYSLNEWRILGEILWMIKGTLFGLLVIVASIIMPAYAELTRGDIAKIHDLYVEAHKQYPLLKEELFDIIFEESRYASFDYKLALAIADAESDFNPKVVSYAGAVGVMQVMPFNYNGPTKDLFDPRTNVRAGIAEMKGHLKTARGNIVEALKNYNSGPHSKHYNVPYIKQIVGNYYGPVAYVSPL